MFIGHYGPAALGAGASPSIKLWQAFIAVQLLDFVYCTLVLLGIEDMRIIPGFTEASALDLHFMPYSHSLLFSVFWAGLGAALFWAMTGRKNTKGAVIFAALVLSHWATDWLVHIPDLTLWPGSEKYGLGLWRNLMVSLPLELVFGLGAMLYFISKTKAQSPKAKIWAGIFLAVLGALQIYSNFAPAPTSNAEFAISALFAYTLLVFLAARFERSRGVAGAV
ncbi:MAG: hypothetical protein ACPGVT_03565 [Maricaulaceae bacterium]